MLGPLLPEKRLILYQPARGLSRFEEKPAFSKKEALPYNKNSRNIPKLTWDASSNGTYSPFSNLGWRTRGSPFRLGFWPADWTPRRAIETCLRAGQGCASTSAPSTIRRDRRHGRPGRSWLPRSRCRSLGAGIDGDIDGQTVAGDFGRLRSGQSGGLRPSRCCPKSVISLTARRRVLIMGP